jgi:hypothetical protein
MKDAMSKRPLQLTFIFCLLGVCGSPKPIEILQEAQESAYARVNGNEGVGMDPKEILRQLPFSKDPPAYGLPLQFTIEAPEAPPEVQRPAPPIPRK